MCAGGPWGRPFFHMLVVAHLIVCAREPGRKEPAKPWHSGERAPGVTRQIVLDPISGFSPRDSYRISRVLVFEKSFFLLIAKDASTVLASFALKGFFKNTKLVISDTNPAGETRSDPPPTASAIFKEVPRHQFSISYLATR